MCPTYCVAKALLNKAVQLMAADEAFKQRGVSVVSVCPGWCRWDGLQHMFLPVVVLYINVIRRSHFAQGGPGGPACSIRCMPWCSLGTFDAQHERGTHVRFV
jgi:NAD(P)-dependent dehydrogenase (short-subunit alcohol dehydrogenase family)